MKMKDKPIEGSKYDKKPDTRKNVECVDMDLSFIMFIRERVKENIERHRRKLARAKPVTREAT